MKPPLPLPLPLPNNSSQEQDLSASSYGFLKPHVLESSSMIKLPPKMLKDKGFISLDHEVIDLDDEDSDTNVVIIHSNFDTNNKGKGIYHHSDHQVKETLASHPFIPNVEIIENANKVESNFPSSSHNFIDLDNCDSAEDDDTWIYYDEIVAEDNYSVFQEYFDHMDIPTGIEAPIPWLPHLQNLETSSSCADPLLKPSPVNQLKLKAGLANSLNVPAEIDLPSNAQDYQSNKKPVASSHLWDKSVEPYEVSHTNSLHGLAKFKLVDSLKRRKKHRCSNKLSIKQSNTMMFGGEISDTSNSVKKQTSLHNMPHSDFPGYMNVGQNMSPWPVESAEMETIYPFFASPMASSLQFYPLPTTHGVDISLVQGDAQNPANVAPGESTSATVSPMDLDTFMANFERFKQFDSVEDHSDHYYTGNGFSMNQAPKKWSKKIQDDWKILENDLPETIFVRVYESRMDLMRAVIIGAEGTPYHDGLFFFDIFFPNNYPDEPPKVHYHSGGLRLNPNLYNCGKVCLSLLNTWHGRGNELWIPDMSTMLQVLVSIQGLILNSKPYFNEPGYALQNGSVDGENKSQRYNEDTFLLSIKTMMYSIKRPPKHYEDFVKGHFFTKAHDILVACKAYTDGTQVGSVVKDEARDLNVGNKSSKGFQNSLNSLLSLLVDALKNIGVDDCEKFVSMQVSPRSKCTNSTMGGRGKAQLES